MADRRDRGAAGLSERLRVKAADMRGPTSSPLYALLLDAAAADVDASGVALEILRPHAGEPRGSALALRFLSAVHRLVLAGRAPQLARHYPSAGGRDPPQGAWQAFRDVLQAHPVEVGAALARPCQTNEAGRCAALLPGFLAIAHEHGPALRIFEIGASAGLNLNWDRYRYEGDGWAWGPPRARLRIAGVSDRMPGHDADVRVVERAGCDSAPLDLADDDTRLTLRAAIWPERVDRLERLDAALAVAREHPPPVERGDAVHWLERRLARPADGCTTVVFHSIVWQYLKPADRERVRVLLAAAGARATAAAPLAWLHLEPAGGGGTAVTLTTWPGRERIVARSGFHGPPVVIAGPD